MNSLLVNSIVVRGFIKLHTLAHTYITNFIKSFIFIFLTICSIAFMIIPLKSYSLDCSGDYIKELSNTELSTKITFTNNLEKLISLTLPDGMQTEQDTKLPPGASISVNLKVNQKTCEYYRQFFGAGSTTKHYSIINQIKPIEYMILDGDFKGKIRIINVSAHYITGKDKDSTGEKFQYWYYVCTPKGACNANISVTNADILYVFTGEGLKETQNLLIKEIKDDRWSDAYDASKNTASLSVNNLPPANYLTIVNHTSSNIEPINISGLNLLNGSIIKLKKYGVYSQDNIQLLGNSANLSQGDITFKFGNNSDIYKVSIKDSFFDNIKPISEPPEKSGCMIHGGNWCREILPVQGSGSNELKLNNFYSLGFYSDRQYHSDFVVYRMINNKKIVIWSLKDLYPGDYNAVAVTFYEGNIGVLGVKNGAKKMVWESNTGGHPGAKIDIIDNVLGVYDKDNQLVYKLFSIKNPSCMISSKANDEAFTCLYKEPDDPMIISAKEGKTLYIGDAWVLDNGGGSNPLQLIMQPDGNVVLYDEINKPLWSLPSWDVNSQYATFLKFQKDGNLVAYKGNNTNNPIFSTQTFGHNNAVLSLQQDKNMVIYSENNLTNPLWSTKTNRHTINSYASLDIFDSPPIKFEICIDNSRQDAIHFDRAANDIFGGFSEKEKTEYLCYEGKNNAASEDIGKAFSFTVSYGSKVNPLVKKYIAVIDPSGEITIKNNGYHVKTSLLTPDAYGKEIITTIHIDDFPEGPYKKKIPDFINKEYQYGQEFLCENLRWVDSDDLFLQASCIKPRDDSKSQLSIKASALKKCQDTGVVIFEDSLLACKSVQ